MGDDVQMPFKCPSLYTLVVHHRPLRVYNGKHFKAVGYRSQAWKSRVLILVENDLLKLVNEKVSEPDAEEDKSH